MLSKLILPEIKVFPNRLNFTSLVHFQGYQRPYRRYLIGKLFSQKCLVILAKRPKPSFSLIHEDSLRHDRPPPLSHGHGRVVPPAPYPLPVDHEHDGVAAVRAGEPPDHAAEGADVAAAAEQPVAADDAGLGGGGGAIGAGGRGREGG